MKNCKIIEDFANAITMIRPTMLKMISLCLLVDICVQNVTIDVLYGCCGMMLLLILLVMKIFNNERITNHAYDAASAAAVMMVEMKIATMITAISCVEAL
jgi:hypothetical protein